MGKMKIGIDQKTLYRLIKKAVREVIKEEEFALFLAHIPEVSDEEMKEIETIGEIPDISDVACEEVIEL